MGNCWLAFAVGRRKLFGLLAVQKLCVEQIFGHELIDECRQIARGLQRVAVAAKVENVAYLHTALGIHAVDLRYLRHGSLAARCAADMYDKVNCRLDLSMN